MELEKLFEAAREASELSYSPYSRFKVGAAILLNNGEIIKGSNIENASYGLSICAERSTLFSAYNKGYNKENIKKVAIFANTNDFISPCGACRQVLSELVSKDCEIYLLNKIKEYKRVSVEELLPFAFNKEDVNGI